MTQIVLWLLTCGAIAAVLTAGAWVWEAGARWSGRPVRWAWLAALAGSVALPFLFRLLPASAWREVVPPVGVVRLDALAISPAEPAGAPAIGVEAVALGLWLLLSMSVVAYSVVLLLRLLRARRDWRAVEVDGAAVLLSRNTGPAAVGVGRGAVVIPAWALELDAELRRLMLLHEREHVQSGDPRVLLGALLLVAVMPWHPLVWLQFLRLRNAIELDCDARVLRRGVDPGRYGSLLLEIGRRRGGGALVLATFAEPRVLLEERIRRIARWPLQRRPVRAALLSVVALALFSTAVLARVRVESAADAAKSGVLEMLGVPRASTPEPATVAPLAVDTPPPVRPTPRPVPYTKAPALRNTAEVMRQMAERHPPLLRDAGIGGTVPVRVRVDERGVVRDAAILHSSGHAALDEAALRVARMMEFEPAEDRGRAVAVWIDVPITFGQLAHSVTVAEPARPQRRPVPDQPTFTPMTVRPELRNQPEVQRALIANYPPLLRAAGIGGTAVIWFYIDEDGRVGKTLLSKSSGQPALDDAALRVADVMQFSPARNRTEIVPVWVEIPILFTARPPRAPERSPAGGETRELPRARVTEAGEAVIEQARRAAPATVEAAVEELRRSAPAGLIPVAARPVLDNAREVQAALIRSYPPALRAAGIGGTAVLILLVDEQGRVTKLQVWRSSGYPALDEAAMRLVPSMRFRPAPGRDTIEPGWIEMPITFTAK